MKGSGFDVYTDKDKNDNNVSLHANLLDWEKDKYLELCSLQLPFFKAFITLQVMSLHHYHLKVLFIAIFIQTTFFLMSILIFKSIIFVTFYLMNLIK